MSAGFWWVAGIRNHTKWAILSLSNPLQCPNFKHFPPIFLLRISPLQGYFNLGKYHAHIFIVIIYSKADVVKGDSWNLTTVTWTLGEGGKKEERKREKTRHLTLGFSFAEGKMALFGGFVPGPLNINLLCGEINICRGFWNTVFLRFAWNIPWLCVTPHTLNSMLLAFSPGINFISKWTCWAEEVSWGSPRLTYKWMPSLHRLRTTELGI